MESLLTLVYCISSIREEMDGNLGNDLRRPQKVKTYDFVKDPPEGITSSDLLSFMGLILSVVGLLFKVSSSCIGPVQRGLLNNDLPDI